MVEWLVLFIMLAGSFFILTAAIGILRMPDLFLRMSASAKAGTLGVGLVLIGVAISFNDFSITSRSIAVITFMLITAPVAAHMIGRAAYFDGIPLWKSTQFDDLKTHYHRSTHELDSHEVIPTDQLPEAVVGDFEGDDFQQEN
jgi:multicomponent Na+:H+ antiporter subunit G